jgi:HTH-type transcriptional regulator/antitoxin HigA
MEIRPIRTDKDHRAALAEIEKLWDASNGTPEGDKLDILVTLVQTYEERRWPLRSRRRFDPVDVLHHAIDHFDPTMSSGRHSSLQVKKTDWTNGTSGTRHSRSICGLR